jgi:hypothetical protein
MYVRGQGVSFEEVSKIIARVSAENYAGNVIVHQDASPIGKSGYGYRGRIIGRETAGEGTRNSWSGRRGPWACWHAYRDVIRAVLTTYPHATVTTAQARYSGLGGFEDTYPHTADINVGSAAQPAYMPDLCTCDDDE